VAVAGTPPQPMRLGVRALAVVVGAVAGRHRPRGRQKPRGLEPPTGRARDPRLPIPTGAAGISRRR
jgi:hypothetical protein